MEGKEKGVAYFYRDVSMNVFFLTITDKPITEMWA
jgi:hypothetical protein